MTTVEITKRESVSFRESRAAFPNSRSVRLEARCAFLLLGASLFAAVLLRGGVYPSQWAWSALGIAAGSLLAAKVPNGTGPHEMDAPGWLLTSLLCWMAIGLVPLPPFLVAAFSPARWAAVSAARQFAGEDTRSWIALSVAPGATAERLLDVVPAVAVFFAIRRLSVYWRSNTWILAAPIITIAWLESLLGFAQFRVAAPAGSAASVVTGTYVNRDHFAGLLEMAFPLALFAAIALWRKPLVPAARFARTALISLGVLTVAGCLLLGIGFSSSRTAYSVTLCAVVLAAATFVASSNGTHGRGYRWRRILLAGLVVALLLLVAPKPLIDRFRDLSSTGGLSNQDRFGIWRDTLTMFKSYKWTGCGLGAFEYGFYRFNSNLPMQTVDFAHNDYLQILAELGFVGALLFAASAASIFGRLLFILRRIPTSPDWELATGLAVSLFAIGFHSLTDFNLYIPANALALAWLCGLAASLGRKAA